MKKAIEKFADQFGWDPILENADSLKRHNKFIVVGMGGSNLSAGLLKAYDPAVDIMVHRNYGLPALGDKELKERLLICSSYSGNTEEVLDAFGVAVKKKLALVVISTGGKLLQLAKKELVPYIQIPDWDLEPRMAVGLNFMAMLRVMGKDSELRDASNLSFGLQPADIEEEGKRLAKRLKGYVPVIYASSRYKAVAYNWKIKFNETAKIPAFFNVFPELNHNEMVGFDAKNSNKSLSDKFYFLILKNDDDHPKIVKRIGVLQELFEARGLPVETLDLKGNNKLERIFNSLILADWTTYYVAEGCGVDPEDISMVEEFKKLIK
ncbi:MAG: SIS domain-containing protein [Patescibacteria group bacterium]